MSRSYRKHPFGGCCNPGTEKWAKRKANRKLRHTNKAEVFHGEKEVFTIKRESSDVWGFPKDGKMYWPKPSNKPDWHDVRIAELRGVSVEQVMEEDKKRWRKFMRK